MSQVKFKQIPPLSKADTDRFWSHVDRSGSDHGCWIWTGSANSKGYGRFFVNGRHQGAHRLSWLLANGSELRRLLGQDRPDLVLAYSISNAYLAMRLARRHAVPFVFHVLDALHTLVECPPVRPIAQAVERRVFVGADRVIVANRKLMEYARRMGAAQHKITYLPA